MLEKNGLANDGGINFFNGVIRDHFLATINDGEIEIQVDDYDPPDGQSWDPELWEVHSCTLIGPATRGFWEPMFRAARGILRQKSIVFIGSDGRRETLEMNGMIVTFGEV